jgi:ATP-binding cassette, subfamily B, bacterial
MNQFLPRSIRTNFQDLLSGARWAIRQAWSANALLLSTVAALSLARGLVPAAMAVTARGLVNATVTTLKGGVADIAPVLPWLILGFIFTLTEALSGLASRVCSQRLRDDLNCRITADVLTHAATLDVAFYEDPRFQDVLQRAKDNPADHVSSFITNLIACTSNALQVVSLLGILVLIEPLIVLVLVVFTLPYLRFQWRLAARQYALEHSRTTKRRWTTYFVSCLTGAPSVGEVRLLRLAPLLIEKFRSLMAEFRDQDRQLSVHGFTRSSVFVVATTAAFYAMFARVAWRVLTGRLTLGDLAIFGGATTRLRNTLESFILSASGAMEQTLYISNVIEFLQARPSLATSGGLIPSSSRAEIELQNVHFTYPGAAEPALAGISLHIMPGETVALVGENGAGKTTLVKLIARLHDPDSGRILFDGVDLRELSLDSLHAHIAFVFQGFGRYEATAADNIAYGQWDRMLSQRDRVQRVARLAGADQMIETMPHGYDTKLGKLFGEHEPSAGQWQQIAVARAFARQASLLILDEPTSNLDARAEYALFTRFRALAKGRTTIIVSHRFSTVSMANRIFVLDRGRLVESGTHQELLARAGNYADLYDLHQRAKAE